MQPKNILLAKQVIETEREALRSAAERINESFDAVVDLLLKTKGKVVVCGMGKSGYIAQKIAATLSSTGTSAVYLHPAEGAHGDLGIYNAGDPTILLSKSGSTEEVLRLIPILKRFNSPLVAIVGNPNSPIAKQSDFVIDASVAKEADPLGIVPTTSALVMLALGDAIACALMSAKNFTEHEFAQYHPGGQLGRNLLMSVKDVMHPAKDIPCVDPEMSLREVVIRMTQNPLGAACVIDASSHLLGIITDGDIRRSLQKTEDFFKLKAREIMTLNPTAVSPDAKLGEAIRLMEDRPRQIMVLPVVDSAHTLLGLIRLHDAYQAH
ncbi:MAG: KpsF/GutQ family protein [Verrucomicrobia bacterium GWC2_42_7]|nr:MAG: KpsF/GutQ family protein [Verrucomicrobia bacterium GWC2_42_7]